MEKQSKNYSCIGLARYVAPDGEGDTAGDGVELGVPTANAWWIGVAEGVIVAHDDAIRGWLVGEGDVVVVKMVGPHERVLRLFSAEPGGEEEGLELAVVSEEVEKLAIVPHLRTPHRHDKVNGFIVEDDHGLGLVDW